MGNLESNNKYNSSKNVNANRKLSSTQNSSMNHSTQSSPNDKSKRNIFDRFNNYKYPYLIEQKNNVKSIIKSNLSNLLRKKHQIIVCSNAIISGVINTHLNLKAQLNFLLVDNLYVNKVNVEDKSKLESETASDLDYQIEDNTKTLNSYLELNRNTRPDIYKDNDVDIEEIYKNLIDKIEGKNIDDKNKDIKINSENDHEIYSMNMSFISNSGNQTQKKIYVKNKIPIKSFKVNKTKHVSDNLHKHKYPLNFTIQSDKHQSMLNENIKNISTDNSNYRTSRNLNKTQNELTKSNELVSIYQNDENVKAYKRNNIIRSKSNDKLKYQSTAKSIPKKEIFQTKNKSIVKQNDKKLPFTEKVLIGKENEKTTQETPTDKKYRSPINLRQNLRFSKNKDTNNINIVYKTEINMNRDRSPDNLNAKIFSAINKNIIESSTDSKTELNNLSYLNNNTTKTVEDFNNSKDNNNVYKKKINSNILSKSNFIHNNKNPTTNIEHNSNDDTIRTIDDSLLSKDNLNAISATNIYQQKHYSNINMSNSKAQPNNNSTDKSTDNLKGPKDNNYSDEENILQKIKLSDDLFDSINSSRKIITGTILKDTSVKKSINGNKSNKINNKFNSSEKIFVNSRVNESQSYFSNNDITKASKIDISNEENILINNNLRDHTSLINSNIKIENSNELKKSNKSYFSQNNSESYLRKSKNNRYNLTIENDDVPSFEIVTASPKDITERNNSISNEYFSDFRFSGQKRQTPKFELHQNKRSTYFVESEDIRFSFNVHGEKKSNRDPVLKSKFDIQENKDEEDLLDFNDDFVNNESRTEDFNYSS